MLLFIPWVVLIVAVIIAVPVAAKLSPGPYAVAKAIPDDAEVAEDAEAVADDVLAVDDFAAEPVGEAIGDDAMAEFG